MNFYSSALPIPEFILDNAMEEVVSKVCELGTNKVRLSYDGSIEQSNTAAQELRNLIASDLGVMLTQYLAPYCEIGIGRLQEEIERLALVNSYLYEYKRFYPVINAGEEFRNVFTNEYDRVSAALTIINGTNT